MGSLFGKSERSRSTNVNRDQLNSAFGGVMGATGDSVNSLQALLGGDASGFRNFANAIDLSGQMEMGGRGITSGGAARGLLRSGATGKALVNYEQMMENQAANSYMQNLLGVGQMGLGAGGIIADAGKESTSRSRDKSGLGKALGSAAGFAMMSDRRLKTKIKHIGRNDEGINVYEYFYKDGSGPYVGVMAQEVAELKPEALGPERDGYMTVDYSKIDPNFYYKVA